MSLVILAILAVGCGSGNFSKPSSVADKNTFRYALSASPTTLDPGRVQDVDTSDLILNVYEGLVSYDEKNRIVGQLAESWKGSDGGKTWTFKLRKGAKFHNGREVNASDVKWSLERNCAPSLDSPTAANYLRDIVGVDDVIHGRAKSILGIRVIDDRTVEFKLDKPRAYFLGKLTYPCAFVLAKEVTGEGPINDVKAAIGTGPFKLVRYDVDQQVELAANPDYYLGTPKIGRILRPIVKDSSTRLNLYRTGQLDFLTIDRKDIKGVTGDPTLKAQLIYQMRPAVYYLGMNEDAYPPFRNRDVRRAFAMAIDRNRICNVLLDGVPNAQGLVAPGIMGYREDYKGLSYDPAAAKTLLAKAGYPDGQGLPPLQLVFRTQTPDSQHVCEGVGSSLRQNLGINVQLTALDWSAFLDGRDKGKLQFYFLSWYADYLDPENFLSFLLTSDSPQNHDGYRNSAFDKLCETGDTTVDEARRIEIYRQAEDLAIQDGARIPIFYQRDALLVSPRVTGIRSNLFGQLPHLTVSLK